jgi:hypothetical protein
MGAGPQHSGEWSNSAIPGFRRRSDSLADHQFLRRVSLVPRMFRELRHGHASGGARLHMSVAAILAYPLVSDDWCKSGKRPQQDSNLRTRLRRAVLYPLSYGGWRTS